MGLHVEANNEDDAYEVLDEDSSIFVTNILLEFNQENVEHLKQVS